jgi:hypothetical protein
LVGCDRAIGYGNGPEIVSANDAQYCWNIRMHLPHPPNGTLAAAAIRGLHAKVSRLAVLGQVKGLVNMLHLLT